MGCPQGRWGTMASQDAMGTTAEPSLIMVYKSTMGEGCRRMLGLAGDPGSALPDIAFELQAACLIVL